MPLMPSSCTAFLTSSSLNGLMIASSFFMASPRCLPPETHESCQTGAANRSEEDPRLDHEAGLRRVGAALAEHRKDGGICAAGGHHRRLAADEEPGERVGRRDRKREGVAARAVQHVG